jgi:hypothetical protein
VCGKIGHTALNCWKRFQKNYCGLEKSVGMAVGGAYGIDPNWYTDSGATDHIAGELEKLHVRDHYNGNDQIHTTSSSGMDIHHIGHSVIHTPSHDLHLNNILHVPNATKSLLSTSRLAQDNHAFVEYWPKSFLLRIRTRGRFCFKVDVWTDFTLYHHHPCLLLVAMLMVRPSPPHHCGIGA